ncbi:hypothetical protein QE152_g7867 [Popillia japonica]|uniref:Uncharacterized protein n=1 Tax=Popillia japonica TaxID=7064 RepID=A0AAW1MDL9_POPJA
MHAEHLLNTVAATIGNSLRVCNLRHYRSGLRPVTALFKRSLICNYSLHGEQFSELLRVFMSLIASNGYHNGNCDGGDIDYRAIADAPRQRI